MAILQLASSKIPAELMERLKQFTQSSGSNQSAVIRQAIEQFLDNAESTGLAQLTHSEFKPSELAARVDSVDARLTDFEMRLMALEGRSPSSSPEPIAVVLETKPVPPPPLTKPLADGGQWLITKEAWQLSQRRGCRRDYAAFSKFAKAHPDRL
ncbi:MAG: ribbon-helix-helix protein, CopG family, partial [Alkalinema sp. FL-bin-369]|nr:ribbon-helix-helix protein, CopG family [Leptolyngbyaceae cyanobacterium LF-bin-369]